MNQSIKYEVHAQHVVDGLVYWLVEIVSSPSRRAAMFKARQSLMVQYGADADIRVTSAIAL